MLNFYLLMNSNHLTTYRAYRKHGHLDLRAQIDVLDQLSEHTESYSELSDEVDQGLISLVDKSTTTIIYTILLGTSTALKKPIEVMQFLLLVLQAPAR